MTDLSEILTLDELATRWRISRRTLYLRLDRGEAPPSFKVGGARRFKLRDVMKFEDKMIEQNENNQGEPQ